MDWDNLRTFLAIARSGRISTAARALGVEHTTVARRLAALESDVGVALFYRTAAGYRLTPHGDQILAAAETMERAALAIAARARVGAEPAGRVRVAMLDEFATHWLAPQLPVFHQRHPAIELQIVVGIQPLDLSRGEAELAVRTPRPRQAGLTAIRLAQAPTGLYASRRWLGGRRLRVEDPAAMTGVPLLIYESAFHQLQSAAWFQPILAAAKIVLTTNSTHLLLAGARAGSGLAVVPRFVAQRYDELTAASPDVATGDIWLVTHPEFRRDPKVRAVAAFLRGAASALRKSP